MNDLGGILLQSLESYLQFILSSQESKSTLYQNFKYKLMLFIEDYTIVPTLLESTYGFNFSNSVLETGSSNFTHTSSITIFRIFIVLLKAQQNIFYKNSMKFRRFGRINAGKESENFTKFSSRMHDFCVQQLLKWRKDNRLKLTEMGEVLIFFFNPLSLLNEIAPKISNMESGDIEGIINTNRTKERESFLAQSSFLEIYIKENILIYSHLFACFLMTFSDIIDTTSDGDVDILFEILSKYFFLTIKRNF